MILSEEERFKHYNINAFLGNPNDKGDIERYPYHQRRLKGCMFHAMCYAYGYTSYESAQEVFGKPVETFKDQVNNIEKTRHPKLVVDVGAGRGELTAAFLSHGVECYAVDPSEGAKSIIPLTFQDWVGEECPDFFINKPLKDALTDLQNDPVDTFIMCESIEHIREEEFTEAYEIMVEMLRRTEGMLVVTNWVGFHPINVDGGGWDHIRRIDDGVYDALCSKAKKTVLRKGSHLVLTY